MVPGEIFPADGDLILNSDRVAVTLMVANTGDRPVQVGSHYHFSESNPALDFDRTAAYGRRLDIAPGTAVRLEPGQRREVNLIEMSGARRVFGFNNQVMGDLIWPHLLIAPITLPCLAQLWVTKYALLTLILLLRSNAT